MRRKNPNRLKVFKNPHHTIIYIFYLSILLFHDILFFSSTKFWALHSASPGHPVAPNFKVSNVDKYEPKQDPGGWLVVYTTAAWAVGPTEDIMTVYLPIVLGQDAL
jgi:hypothetical protein